MRRLEFVLLLCLALTPTAQAVDRYANPGNFYSQFTAAQPGDRVILAPGTYGRYWLPNKSGTPDNLIQVIAEDPMNRPVFDAGGNSECLQIASCSYMLFDGLVVQNAIDEGIHLQSAGGPFSHHIIMKNCTVTMPSTSGNTDNWKSDYTSNTLFYNCTADVNGDTGFDFMGSTDCLIMRCTSTGGNSGAHAKNGAHNIGYYKNYFSNVGERNFQFGGNGLYNYDQIAMGNLVVGASPQSVVYTTARYDEFRYNTVQNLNSAGVIRILNEGDPIPPTGENTFSNNLVDYVGSSYAGAGPYTDPASFIFADNFWSATPTLPAPETGRVVGDPQLNGEYLPENPAARDYGAYAPAMETAWADYTDRFAWAWAYAQLYEPRAEPGSYQVGPGDSIVIDGQGSYAGTSTYGDYTINQYEWDLDGDGLFDDAVGATVALSYDDLAGMGLGEGTHHLGLRIRITNEMGQDVFDEGWGTLTVVSEPTPALVSSDPPADGTLCKSQNNVILVTFDADITLPVGQPALSIFGGGFEEGGAFAYSVEPDGVTLKAVEEGPILTDQTWYHVTPTAGFEVESFAFDLCTLIGDANNSGRVTTADYSEVKLRMGEYTDARYDLNGSGRVTTADYSVVKANLGHRAPAKP